MKIYGLIPAYNEEETIREVVSRLKKIGLSPLIIDDCSKDSTSKLAEKAGAVVIRHKTNKGKGEAIKTGFDYILKNNPKTEYVVLVDADLQYDPLESTKLLKPLQEKKADFVTGYRNWRIVPFRHKLGNFVWRNFFNILFGTKFKDTNCLPCYEKLFVIVDNKPNILEIGELYELYSKNKDIQILVPSFNPITLKVEFVPISEIIKVKEKKKIVKIKLEDYNSCYVSFDHPLIVINKNGMVVKSAFELNKDDFLPVCRKLPELAKTKKSIDLLKMFEGHEDIFVKGGKDIIKDRINVAKKFNFGYQNVANWYFQDAIPLRCFQLFKKRKSVWLKENLRLGLKGQKKSHTIPSVIKLDQYFARLIGYYLAEGCRGCYKKQRTYEYEVIFTFNKNEKKLIDDLKEILKKVFGISFIIINEKNSTHVVINNKLIYLFFEKLGLGKNSYTMIIPSFVFLADREFIKNLLKAYFDGDGHVNYVNSSYVIKASTINEKLAYGIYILLSLLGLQSSIRFYRDRWKISIHTGKNFEKIIKYFDLEFEDRRRQKCLSIFDKYPIFLLSEVPKVEDRNLYMSLFYARKKNYKLTVGSLKKLKKYFSEPLKKLFSGDLHILKVEKVEEVGVEDILYDIKVQNPSKPYENFMTTSGIFLHNCGFMALTRKSMKKVKGAMRGGYTIENALFIEAIKKGMRINQVPVSVKYKEKSGVSRGVRMVLGVLIYILIEGLKYRFGIKAK